MPKALSHPLTEPALWRRTPVPAAVLWDFDGTLVDTEPFWIEVEFEMVGERGGSWSMEQAHHLVGQNNVYSAGQLIAACPEQGLTVEQWIPEMVSRVVEKLRTRDVPWLPGGRELVQAFSDAGVPQAIVTASPPALVLPVLDHLPRDTFATVVTGDQVSQGKPHPEPYLTGAARLGVEAGDCIAFEDSAPGCRSAMAAGAFTITVPSPTTAENRVGDVHLDGLAGITLDDVLDLWRTA